jgi:hypothetical protein
MFKNTAASLLVFAFNRLTNFPATGEAANITCKVRIDGGSADAIDDTNPTELDATAEAGYYRFDLAAAETNGDQLNFIPRCSTSGVQVIALPASIFTEPYAASGTLPAYNGSGMTVATAREFVRDSLRDGGDSSHFATATIDRSIQMAGDEFCRRTRAVVRTDSVAITAASTSFPLTAPIAAGFRPLRVLDAWVQSEETPLILTDYEDVNRLHATYPGRSGVPTHLGFLDESGNGYLFPTPSEAATAKLRYALPFTTWTAGSGDDTSLNIPTDLIIPVLKYGAAANALGANKETRELSGHLRGLFEQYIAETRGLGGLGVKEIQRSPNPRRLGRRATFLLEGGVNP